MDLYQKVTVLLLLTFTGKLAAYLLLLSLTSITSCSIDSDLESELQSAVLSKLPISVLHGASSIFIGVCLGVQVSEVILFTKMPHHYILQLIH